MDEDCLQTIETITECSTSNSVDVGKSDTKQKQKKTKIASREEIDDLLESNPNYMEVKLEDSKTRDSINVKNIDPIISQYNPFSTVPIKECLNCGKWASNALIEGSILESERLPKFVYEDRLTKLVKLTRSGLKVKNVLSE